jgi:glycosyltransferase involved in cell wall biosynthesis
MHILLLSQWYLPEPVKYVSDLAEALQAQGNEVTVLTGFPNYPTGKLAAGYQLRCWQRETIGGVPLIRVPLFPDHSTSPFRRLFNFGSFAASSSLLGPWLVPRVDVMHVIHPPLTIGLPAGVLSRWLGCPFTYEVQDLWPEVLRATGSMRSERIFRMMSWYAKRVYRRAAAIRVISPGFRENLIAKGVPAEKIHVISNWVDTDLYKRIPPDTELAEKLGMNGKFNVMFAGAIGLSQGFDAVMEAAALLREMPEVQFVFVGDGADLPRLQKIAAEKSLANVKFLGRYPAQEMPGLYALADALLVHLRADPLYNITIPHKIFAYMASGKPLLAAVAGDPAAVVERAKAGLTCPPANPVALVETIKKFLAMPASQRAAMGDNGYRLVHEEYRRDLLTAKVADMLQEVVEIKAARS